MSNEPPRIRLSAPSWWVVAVLMIVIGAIGYVMAPTLTFRFGWGVTGLPEFFLSTSGIGLIAFGFLFFFNHEVEGTYRCLHCGERVALRKKKCPACGKSLI